MKTYSENKLEKLLKVTIKSKEIKNNTYYLDELTNGEFSVSKDEFNLGIFDNLDDAEVFYNKLN